MATSNKTPAANVQDTRVRRFSDLRPEFAEMGIWSQEQLGIATGARIGGGVVIWKDTEYSYTLWYDEIIYCHALKGSLEIEIDGTPQRLTPGDMIYLPNGTAVTYRAVGEATLFYAVTPVDWASRIPADLPKA